MADSHGDVYNNDQMVGLQDEESLMREVKQELETWKAKVDKADDKKAMLILEKLEEDEAKAKMKNEMVACVKEQEVRQKEFSERQRRLQEEVQQKKNDNLKLLDELKRLQAELDAKRAESSRLSQKFKICTQIADTEVNFIAEQKAGPEDGDQAIRGVFTISQKAALQLTGGQALLTFEEEKVASQILELGTCCVPLEDSSVNVTPVPVSMDPAVKFEVHLDVSTKDLKVFNVPPSMKEDRMKDRLEMSFSRPSRGGGEVERVVYDKNTGTGCISFLQPGVAEKLALEKTFLVDLEPSVVSVQVEPVFNYQLRKFQTFRGSDHQTVLLEDIQAVADEDDLQDYLEIHFQKPGNGGGEIKHMQYVARGKNLQAFFCEEPMEAAN